MHDGRSAVVAAYEQLLAEGYTSGRHGSGTYISPDLPEPIEAGPAGALVSDQAPVCERVARRAGLL